MALAVSVQAGASLVHRWTPKPRRQQHTRVEPGGGRSSKDEGTGAAGWLQPRGWKPFWGHHQEDPTQVRRVNAFIYLSSVRQHCPVLTMVRVRSDNKLRGSCSHGVCIVPKAGCTRNLPREGGLPDPWAA